MHREVSCLLHLLVIVNDLLNHGGFGEGADVPQVVELVGRYLPQYPAHYLTRSGLGQPRCDLGSFHVWYILEIHLCYGVI